MNKMVCDIKESIRKYGPEECFIYCGTEECNNFIFIDPGGDNDENEYTCSTCWNCICFECFDDAYCDICEEIICINCLAIDCQGLKSSCRIKICHRCLYASKYLVRPQNSEWMMCMAEECLGKLRELKSNDKFPEP